ncbi:PREDICTED: SID1 transmembrane family member 2-like isoform X4 [Amphimedon queenslandica]|uniref:SID1 transmembrane family member 1 n=1 Tax=Amphimedon queenslandica TaxID=400682 RepID=A0A1X7UYY6_AMPQE|nr:PREDICTED: SID1 transmembrane family member 2-like isoform X4 [Amphimedon queenslandica]|eukprot:XP_011403694.2 PREDICTED: SID1 transmembrane family member 2-like isoform X4 [Amphimedon queenslandica]
MATIFSPWPLSCFLSSILLLLSGSNVAHCEMVEAVLELNDTASLANVTGFVSASASWTLRLETEGISSERAIRISTSSSYANLSFPLLISVRQGRHISSWTLPFIEAGHATPVVSKTLCPLFNKPMDDNSTINIIYIDVSTPALNNVSFNLSASIINQYQLRINNPVNEVVSASSPVSYVFEYPEGVDRVLVKVTSDSMTCALVSVQEGLCPVDQLLDYPDHRGTFQTMQLLAGINIKRPVHQNFIYIVVSVYHHDNCSQTNHDFFDGLVTLNTAANYNPTFISSNRLQELSKTVTIEISHTLSYSGYAVACVLLVVAFGLLVIGIGIFFIIDEFCCYRRHVTYKFLKKLKEEEGIEDIFEAVDGEEAEGKKRKWDKCTSYLKMACAIICGRQYFNKLNKLKEKEEKINQSKENNNEKGVTGDEEEETDFSLTKRRHSYNRAVSDEELGITDHLLDQNPDTNTATNDTDTATATYDRAVSEELEDIKVTDSLLDQSHDPNTDPNQYTNIDPNHGANTDQNHDTNTATNDTAVTKCDRFCSLLKKTNDPFINELTFVDGKKFQDSYNPYWIYLSVIVVFYSLPVYQLMLTYQRYVSVSGSEDFCYYNTLCSHPLWGLSAFNNVWSNVSFLFLGVLFIFLAIRRRSIYRVYESINIYYENKGKPERKVGVPQYFGIYYASGVALIGEALMSGAYHICPTGNNYQFDTTMMFVLLTLGIYQLFKSRNPDIIPSPHKLLLLLSLLILFIAFGVIYPTMAFYIVFFFIYELGVVWVSLQLYWRWKAWDILKEIRTDIICAVESKDYAKLRERFTPSAPADSIRFFYLLMINVINFGWSLGLLIIRPRDFATNFLFLLIVNYLLSLSFVLVIKLPAHHYKNCGRKKALLKPFIYLSMSVAFWLAGFVFYTQEVTNWLDSPAVSRNNNKECFLFGFYDTHDMWHICSAFGIFFSFLLMMTLEDHVEFKKRSEIRVY